MRKTKLEDWMLASAASMWVGWLWFDFTPKSWPPILGFLAVTPVVVLVALWLAWARMKSEPIRASLSRLERQKQIYLWAKETFGDENIRPDERARRFLEEALELAQAQGLGIDDVKKLAAHVFSKPAGDAPQEIGGVGLTLLAYAESIGVAADVEERIELARVLNIQKEVFRERHNKKADAGVAVRAPE